MADKEKIKTILELFLAWNGETEAIDVANLDSAVEFIEESLQKEPTSEELEEFVLKYVGSHAPYDSCMQEMKDAVKAGVKWQKEQMMAKAIDGKVLINGMGNPILHLWDKGRHLIDKKVKVIVIKED